MLYRRTIRMESKVYSIIWMNSEQTDKRLIHRGCQQELISETLKEKNSSFSLRLEIVEGGK